MKAILCRRPGGPDDLTLADIPDPARARVKPWSRSQPRD